jgi:hypothetical protein
MAGAAGEAELAALDAAAPEVLRGRRATRASDVHALAVIVAQIISGSSPPAFASVVEAVHRGLRRPPPVLDETIPLALAKVLRRSLSRHPWRRPSAVALVQALRDAQHASPVTAPARLRRRALITAAAIAVTAIAVALAHRAGSAERAVSARLAGGTRGARQLLRELDARPGLGRDRRLREDAFALAARGEDRRAVVALLARLPDADDDLLQMTRSPRYWTRWNAVRALEARGTASRVDRSRVYALDLLHAGSCDTRRAAAARLTSLRDPSVIPELTRAYEAAQSSWTEWWCTGREVERALRAARKAQR